MSFNNGCGSCSAPVWVPAMFLFVGLCYLCDRFTRREAPQDDDKSSSSVDYEKHINAHFQNYTTVLTAAHFKQALDFIQSKEKNILEQSVSENSSMPIDGDVDLEEGTISNCQSDESIEQQGVVPHTGEFLLLYRMKRNDHDLVTISLFPPTNEDALLLEIPNKCAICLESYKVTQRITLSSSIMCQHAFHEKCAKDWFFAELNKRRASTAHNNDKIGLPFMFTCPCCRQPFIDLRDYGTLSRK